jgi:acetyltransferase-like isoleucine patch superfamily enzyme
VGCGAYTLIRDTDWHTADQRSSPDASVLIGVNVWLRANVTMLKGVGIEENTLVATGSLVTKSLPANVVAARFQTTVIRTIRVFDY